MGKRNLQDWEYLKGRLKEELPDAIYKVWFAGLQGYVREKKLILEVPNEFAKGWLKENYSHLLEKVTLEAGLLGYEFLVKEVPKAEQMLLPFNPLEVIGRKFSAKYSLDDFVVGKSNEFAFKVCSRLVDEVPKEYFIYLCGNYGLGKTHLTQGVGQALLQRGFDRIYYFSAQDFLNYLLKYLKAGQIENFKEIIKKNCDLLLLDGLHFLVGKDYTQRELTLLIDYLLDQGKTVFFTSLKLPQELKDIDSAFRSRLNGSLIIKLNEPDFDTRKKIIRYKAKKEGYKLPSEVVEYMARQVRGDVRQLESVVYGLIARANILREPVNLTLAKELLNEISLANESSTDIELILDTVCRSFGITKEEIFSLSRKRNCSTARQAVIYLLKHVAKKNIKEIAQFLKKEHSTIIYHLKIFEKKLNENRSFRMQFNFMMRDLSKELASETSLLSEDDMLLEVKSEPS
ncbi:MAG: DnaA ATPase domain-containing protein [Caldimicrobium sp.]